MNQFRVIFHTHLCPDCGSDDITEAEVQTGDGITEIALTCHTGARLVEVIWQAGIGFTLTRICEGTRRTERAIKNDGGAVRYCPACTNRPWNGHWPPITGDLIPRTYPNLAGRR